MVGVDTVSIVIDDTGRSVDDTASIAARLVNQTTMLRHPRHANQQGSRRIARRRAAVYMIDLVTVSIPGFYCCSTRRGTRCRSSCRSSCTRHHRCRVVCCQNWVRFRWRRHWRRYSRSSRHCYCY